MSPESARTLLTKPDGGVEKKETKKIDGKTGGMRPGALDSFILREENHLSDVLDAFVKHNKVGLKSSVSEMDL